MTKFYNLTLKATQDVVDDIINQPVYELNQTMWDDINDPFNKEMVAVFDQCTHTLTNGFAADNQSRVEFCRKFEEDIR